MDTNMSYIIVALLSVIAAVCGLVGAWLVYVTVQFLTHLTHVRISLNQLQILLIDLVGDGSYNVGDDEEDEIAAWPQ